MASVMGIKTDKNALITRAFGVPDGGRTHDIPLWGQQLIKKRPLREGIGVPDGGRTHNSLIHSQVLCH